MEDKELDPDMLKFEAMLKGEDYEETVEPTESTEEVEEELEVEPEPTEEVEEDLDVDSEEDTEELEAEEEVDTEPVVEDVTEPIVDTEPKEPSEAEKHKGFYDALINSEIMVKGKPTKVPTDPAQILEAIKFASNAKDDLVGIKEVAPFIDPLRNNGMLKDPEKFKLAMDMFNPDPAKAQEAIKQHLQSLNVDPIDLNMEEIGYTPTTNLKSEGLLGVERSYRESQVNGYGDKFFTLANDVLDDASYKMFEERPDIRASFQQHMATGYYDTIMDKIKSTEAVDFSGEFGKLSTIDKYQWAMGQVPEQVQAPVVPVAPTIPQGRIEPKNEEVNKQRLSASAVSKPKRKTSGKKKVVDPSMEDPMGYLDKLMRLGQ